MKNLLQRLKPEYLELLNKDAIKYPFLVQGIKIDLRQNISFTNLSVGSALQLCTVCKVIMGVTELNNLFEANE
jgi:hypothetical protein